MDILKELGPFIAIHNPGKSLPELGAARMRVHEETWQKEVYKLLFDSQFVIIYAAAFKDVLKEQQDKVKSLVMSMNAPSSRKPDGLTEAIAKLYELQLIPKDVKSGLLWEISEAVKMNLPRKLILAIPVDLESYEGFRKATAGLFPKPLPEPSSVRNLTRTFIENIEIRGFVCFDSAWKPSFVPIRTPTLRTAAAEKVALKEALDEVFECLGKTGPLLCK